MCPVSSASQLLLHDFLLMRRPLLQEQQVQQLQQRVKTLERESLMLRQVWGCGGRFIASSVGYGLRWQCLQVYM